MCVMPCIIVHTSPWSLLSLICVSGVSNPSNQWCQSLIMINWCFLSHKKVCEASHVVICCCFLFWLLQTLLAKVLSMWLLQVSWWPFAGAALGLFIYQSLDAIDGKQARRTNSSSSLGELFDHGCDSVSMGMAVIPCH